MSERTQDFYVSPLERVFGILSIVLAVVMVILLNVYSTQKLALKEQLPDDSFRFGNSTVFITSDGSGVIDSAYDNTVWNRIEACERAMTYCLVAMVCLIPAALTFLAPKLIWFLESLRWRMWFDGDPSPSDFYLITAQIFKYVIFAVGVLCGACAMTYLV